MTKPLLSVELKRQKELDGLDLLSLSKVLISEACSGEGISESSFLALVQLFTIDEVLRSDQFHSITSAIWTDRETLSQDQSVRFADFLRSSQLKTISSGNAFSLCDMIANYYPEENARELLAALSKRADLHHAAEYSLSTLK
ncbi:hypothetical protein KX928_14515 [Roseobacter sp. YSTF-M11]|uniref:Uncharacterized protein n=1 Tax=Roseobacter insulae TaxID=2859783 RepID=A0A9X1FXS7_9RHOB|nr:hypothetical protein [Roseobacter insulae]MBW4709000.1 hypothetical protein [Roseobacter insulae]